MTTDFSDVLDRIQEKIPTDKITPRAIAKFLGRHDKRGQTLERRKLGTEIANTIQTELKIATSFSVAEDFAEERGIKLTEKTKGGVYDKWGRYGRKAVVIFKSGKIFKWKYLK